MQYFWTGAICVVALWLVVSSIIIINQVERGVVFRFGKVVGVKEPGIRMRFPFGIDVVRKVDLRTRTTDVPQQEVITKDNISILVDAVVYYNVQNPTFALTRVVIGKKHYASWADNLPLRFGASMSWTKYLEITQIWLKY